ncbi:MAG TPA: NlpC/P60 family protein [Candidatus Woesebacteria bacterium]|nr:NlpC/P60 family protein [Candidatus Woesebacteria bacterium]
MANGVRDKINELSGDSRFLSAVIENIFQEKEIKTSREEVGELVRVIGQESRGKSESEIQIEAKKISLEIERWKEKNPDLSKEYKKEEFKKNFHEEAKKINPSLSEEQSKKIEEYGELVSDNSFDKNVLDGYQNEALEANKDFGPGKLENSWSDLKQVVNFIQKSPEEIKNIKDKYNSLKEGLKDVKVPSNSKEVRSFEKIVSSLNNPGTDQLFSKTKNFLGRLDKIDKLTGGWLNKTVTDAGMKMVSKIGNQTIQEFATNSLNVLVKEGFQQGFSTVLNGVLSGGVKAAATTGTTGGVATATGVAATSATGAAAGATGAAAGGAAAATGAAAAGLSATGIGAIVVAAAAVLKVVKDVGNKIAEKLGIDTKQFFEEKFGKVGGFFVKQTIKITTITTISLIPIIVVGLVIFLFINAISTGSSVSSLVPPGDEVQISETLYDETYVSSNEPIVLPTVIKNQKPTGQMIVDMARSLSAKVCYYWGGKSNVIGIDPKWGQKITPDHMGRDIAGLDCSGFVNWVYHQYGYSLGKIKSMYDNYTPISENDLQPGDIGIIGYEINGKNGWHVGIFTGRDAEGKSMWIHSGSTSKSLGVCKSGFVAETHDPGFTKFARIL